MPLLLRVLSGAPHALRMHVCTCVGEGPQPGPSQPAGAISLAPDGHTYLWGLRRCAYVIMLPPDVRPAGHLPAKCSATLASGWASRDQDRVPPITTTTQFLV
eukprot:356607-Chlamydomonas_euryale.AAC.2